MKWMLGAMVACTPVVQVLPAHLCDERAFSYPRRFCWGNAPTLYNAFWILDAKVARPPHATWYVRRVSLPPALQALTCRLGAPAHPCNKRAFSCVHAHFRSFRPRGV